MYSLPDDFAPQALVGRVLEQLTFTQNTLRLEFDGDVAITALGEVIYQAQDEQSASSNEVLEIPIEESSIMRLLGHEIVDCAVEGRGTLVLSFDNGHKLRCVENTDQYECYWLRIGDHEIIV